jgi:DHA2 family multidrug resistance protein
MVNAQAQMLAFSDTFIVIAIVSLLALIPAALLSRSQQPVRRLAWR